MILRASTIALTTLALASAPFINALSSSDIPADTPVSHLIKSANAAQAAGNLQDAITYFDAAVHKSPDDYMTFYRRGLLYRKAGKSNQAVKDFDQVLTLRPKFPGALVQRAELRSRNAEWDAARQDYHSAGKAEEAAAVDEAEGAAKLAVEAEKVSNWEDCVTQAGTAILVAGTSLDLRQRRARCRFAKGEIMEGIADLAHALQIVPGLAEAHLQISAMTFYTLGETEKGTVAISKCLHNDPDNKACLKLRRSEKAVERALKKLNNLFDKHQYASAIRHLLPSPSDPEGEPGLLAEVKTDSQDFRDLGYIHPQATDGLYFALVEKTCEAYTEMNSLKKSISYCDEALTYNPTSLPALLSKAQRQLEDDEFDPSIATLNTAKEHHGNNQKIAELMQKAQTLLKRSKTKDYYKVLGVSRDADEREIKKAFRKLTVQNHPDKARQHGIDPEEAQKKMAAINEAHEVLSDPELRARFDRGDDPNDPTGGQGGNPFQGSPFGFGQGGQPVFFRQGHGSGGGGYKFQGGGGGFPGGFPFG
ncbi:DnaJ-domain-containing protein [Polychaeton citri CBS 116435]|uniref:Tetratricopeptide repeat and J domain-containing co-chaperone DNJ1 n=1 Tax=Polychaeton citri CBS 116435 TaxID=1314669 RepID=A0A9P4PZ65_9PEZI|nr:DnaJ-domain-containing protein [Polychaeton citri CBS 116435]